MQPVRVVRERGGLEESEHLVRVAVWRRGAVTCAGGDPGALVYLRSSAKPVQALACVLSGAADRFGYGGRELALACASHNGEPFHVATAAEMLRRAGLAPDALQCGAHPPVHEPSARALIRAGEAPTALHNNCSGKHAAMLAACVASGWSLGDYLEPAHPLQRLNRENVARTAGVTPEQVHIAIDGCSAPVFAVPLGAAARLVATVADPAGGGLAGELRAAAERLGAAVRAAPEMLGGTGRSDTDVIRATGGRVLCKVGAEGVWCLGVAERGLGVTVKCLDGSAQAARHVGLELLRACGVLDDAAWEALLPHRDTVVRNHRGLDTGRVRVELPDALVAAAA